MRRVLIAAVACATPLWSTAAAQAASSPPPRAQLTGFTCRQAQNPSHRQLAVTAVMRPVSGTQTMAIRFTLLRQVAPSHSFRPVHTGDLDRWIAPADPTLGQRPDDVWKLDKVVKDLPGPAVYQLRATFRWTGSHHRMLARVQRTTPICRAD